MVGHRTAVTVAHSFESAEPISRIFKAKFSAMQSQIMRYRPFPSGTLDKWKAPCDVAHAIQNVCGRYLRDGISDRTSTEKPIYSQEEGEENAKVVQVTYGQLSGVVQVFSFSVPEHDLIPQLATHPADLYCIANPSVELQLTCISPAFT